MTADLTNKFHLIPHQLGRDQQVRDVQPGGQGGELCQPRQGHGDTETGSPRPQPASTARQHHHTDMQ